MTPPSTPRYPKRSGQLPRKQRLTLASAPPSSLRVATYTRISTDETNQPYSLDAQAEHLSRYLALRPEMVLTERYTDQMSGSKFERPGLQHLLADVRAGRFDVVLVYRVDRFSRSMRHLQELIEVLEQHNVAFVSATEAFDTSNSMGRMVLNLLGVFAEFERASMIDRIRAGIATKASRGEWVGGVAPYGYVIAEGKTLAIVEEEAAVVREIFRLCVEESLGAIAIASRLNDAGYRTRTRRAWDAGKILQMLRRPTYAGWIVHRDETYPGQHEPIVDLAIFDKAQQILQERGAPWQRRSDSLDYRLAGLLRCTSCGSHLVGERAKGRGGTYRYYICSRRKMTNKHGCATPRYSAEVLEDAVLAMIISVYRDFGLFTEAAKRAIQAREKSLPDSVDQLARVEAEVRKAQSALDRYLFAFEDGTMDAQACAPRIRELQDQLNSLTAHRDQLQLIVDSPAPVLPSEQDIHGLADSLEVQLTTETGPQLKNLLRHLIDHIDVSPQRVVTPYLRVPEIGTVELDPGSMSTPTATGSTPPVAVATQISPDRLRRGGHAYDKVLDLMAELEQAGQGPEFRVKDILDLIVERYPEVNRRTLWRTINRYLCYPRKGQTESDLIRVRKGVLRRRTP